MKTECSSLEFVCLLIYEPNSSADGATEIAAN